MPVTSTLAARWRTAEVPRRSSGRSGPHGSDHWPANGGSARCQSRTSSRAARTRNTTASTSWRGRKDSLAGLAAWRPDPRTAPLDPRTSPLDPRPAPPGPATPPPDPRASHPAPKGSPAAGAVSSRDLGTIRRWLFETQSSIRFVSNSSDGVGVQRPYRRQAKRPALRGGGLSRHVPPAAVSEEVALRCVYDDCGRHVTAAAV